MSKWVISLWVSFLSLGAFAVPPYLGQLGMDRVSVVSHSQEGRSKLNLRVVSTYDEKVSFIGSTCVQPLWSASASLFGPATLPREKEFAFLFDKFDLNGNYSFWELQSSIAATEKPDVSTLLNFAHQREFLNPGSTFANYLRLVALIEDLNGKPILSALDKKRLRRAITEASWLTYQYGEKWFYFSKDKKETEETKDFSYFFPEGNISITLDGALISHINVETDLINSFPRLRLQKLLDLFPRLNKFRFFLNSENRFRVIKISSVEIDRGQLQYALTGTETGEEFVAKLKQFPIKVELIPVVVAK